MSSLAGAFGARDQVRPRIKYFPWMKIFRNRISQTAEEIWLQNRESIWKFLERRFSKNETGNQIPSDSKIHNRFENLWNQKQKYGFLKTKSKIGDFQKTKPEKYYLWKCFATGFNKPRNIWLQNSESIWKFLEFKNDTWCSESETRNRFFQTRFPKFRIGFENDDLQKFPKPKIETWISKNVFRNKKIRIVLKIYETKNGKRIKKSETKTGLQNSDSIWIFWNSDRQSMRVLAMLFGSQGCAQGLENPEWTIHILDPTLNPEPCQPWILNGANPRPSPESWIPNGLLRPNPESWTLNGQCTS